MFHLFRYSLTQSNLLVSKDMVFLTKLRVFWQAGFFLSKTIRFWHERNRTFYFPNFTGRLREFFEFPNNRKKLKFYKSIEKFSFNCKYLNLVAALWHHFCSLSYFLWGQEIAREKFLLEHIALWSQYCRNVRKRNQFSNIHLLQILFLRKHKVHLFKRKSEAKMSILYNSNLLKDLWFWSLR